MLSIIWQLSLVAGLLNDIKGCKAAPNCRSRNRRACQSPMSSCGKCLPGFAGVEGDANEPCYIPMDDARLQRGGEVLEIDFSLWQSGSQNEKEKIVEIVRGVLIRGSGFLYLKNHGIPKTLISTMLEEVVAFFDQPITIKKATSLWIEAAENSGYVVLGQEGLDEDDVRGDPKEAYDMNLEHLRSSIWNTTSAVEYWRRFSELTIEVLRLYARVLKLEDGEFFTKSHNEEWHTLRFLHYPPQDAVQEQVFAEKRAGAHSDYGSLTFLVQDNIGGLELYDRHLQNWVPVPPREGTVVINTGDLLMRWTNDMLVSTLHRVITPNGVNANKSRYAIPFFVQPNKEWVIDSKDVLPDQSRVYPPITSLDYLVQRLESTYYEQENLNKNELLSADEIKHTDL